MDDDENIEFYPSSCWGKCCKRKRFGLNSEELKAINFLRLKSRVKYDKANAIHQQFLIQLWNLSFSTAPNLISEDWILIGFQGQDPSQDFRGGGLFSLQQLIHFATKYSSIYEQLKTAEYSFAICSINLTYFLTYYFQLLPNKTLGTSDCRKAPPAVMKVFAKLCVEDQSVIDFLHAVGVVYMHKDWLRAKSSGSVTIMDFMKSLIASTYYIEELLLNKPTDFNHLTRMADVSI